MSNSKQPPLPPWPEHEWTRTVLEVLVPKDRTCIESDKVAAIRNVEEQEAIRPLQVASDLIEAAHGRTVTVEHSIALLQEAREWIALGVREGRTVNL
jgi:hypothetical protein